MAINIKIRRNSSPGVIPTIAELNLGEIAINTHDGCLYFKKRDVNTNIESIISLCSGSAGGGAAFPFTGSAQITGSLGVTGSISSTGGLTGSLQGTSSWANNAITASYASFASTSSLPLRGIITASAANTTITFTKGDGTTFDITVAQSGSVATASYALFAETADTASYASFAVTAATASFITASNVFGPFGSNSILSSSYALTASYILQAVSSSFATTSSVLNITNTTTGIYYPTFVISGSGALPQLVNSASFSYNATTNTLTVTSSFATSASFAISASRAVSSSFATSASFAISASRAVSSSFATSASFAISASRAVTASYVLNAISSSFAATASSADNFTVRGTLTAQTIVTQVITSSTDFVTGSTRFGTLLSNTHQFTGSVSITGSLNVVGDGITGSLFGTASWANNATTASYALNAVSSSFASTSSFVTASNVWGPFGSNSVLSSSFALTASFVATASLALNALTASYVDAANVVGLTLFQIATGSITASVNIDPTNLFLIKSGSTRYFNISSSGNVDVFSNLFIIRNFTTQQPVLTVSQSIVQIATQSAVLTNVVPAGSIYFTSNSFYVGLD